MNNQPPNKHPADYEEQDISVKKLALITTVCVVVTALAAFFLYDYFIVARETAVLEQELKTDITDLSEIRAREQEALSTYLLLDSTRGTYQIPIERAIELVAWENQGISPDN